MTIIQFLAEWAMRSSILILSGAVLLWGLRVKDSSIRLAAWTAVLCGSSIMPLMTIALPTVPVTVTPGFVRSITAPVVFYENAPEPVPAVPTGVVAQRPRFDWARVGIVLYLLIAFGLLARLGVGLALSFRLLRQSRASTEPGIRESEGVAAPVTLGILHPVIVLPPDWSEWDSAKRKAVLAHERSHIRRYDPAVQLLSAVHRALLWFSPLSWFLHHRIVRVAEEASDDAAVAVTRDRAAYAEVLLDFVRQATPGANLAGVPMARYGSPDKRIHRILDATSLSRGMTRWSVAAIFGLAAPLTYLTASATPHDIPARTVARVEHAVVEPAVIPASVPIAEKAVATPRLIAQAAPHAPPPPVAAERPKFEVASIRPCDPNYVPPGGRGGGAPTDRFRRNCVTVKSLISDAYIRFADGQNRSPMASMLTEVEGGPTWLNTDLYTIKAEAEGAVEIPMMAGPMMQTLLEDRFQLRVHRETREGPAYALTLAKGNSKTLAAKGTPCVAADFVNAPFPFHPGDDRPCVMSWMVMKGTNMVWTVRGISMEELTQHLTLATGRLVVDKTGITGNVDLDLVYASGMDVTAAPVTTSADGVPRAEDPAGPSIFTALRELGLKLQPARGPREYLVIDRVSRPSAN